ncbi:MAG TPA: thermonuclease family protein [Bacilli bacterium]|nr:thermonuclease family protein [Bacilli bacterium]
MKKIIFILILFIFNINIYAEEANLNKCVDGDTAKFNINNKIETVRFLAINTPEKDEYYGKEASEYTCYKLKSAKVIEIELDNNSDKYDKYNRLLAWIWIDNKLLQNSIIKSGYGKVAYLYGDYSYTNILKESEDIAKTNKIGVWKEYNSNKDIIILVTVLIFIILGIVFNKSKYYKKALSILRRRDKSERQ